MTEVVLVKLTAEAGLRGGLFHVVDVVQGEAHKAHLRIQEHTRNDRREFE
jgi:hypothetical protein